MNLPANDRHSPRSPGWERVLALLLRTVHLMAVVGLGAALLGAPLGLSTMGGLVLGSGLGLLALDLVAQRLRLFELAGAVVLLKLAASAWMTWGSGGQLHLFWALVALSSLSAHAPKSLRHWRPCQSRSSSAGSPG